MHGFLTIAKILNFSSVHIAVHCTASAFVKYTYYYLLSISCISHFKYTYRFLFFCFFFVVGYLEGITNNNAYICCLRTAHCKYELIFKPKHANKERKSSIKWIIWLLSYFDYLAAHFLLCKFISPPLPCPPLPWSFHEASSSVSWF